MDDSYNVKLGFKFGGVINREFQETKTIAKTIADWKMSIIYILHKYAAETPSVRPMICWIMRNRHFPAFYNNICAAYVYVQTRLIETFLDFFVSNKITKM